MSQTHTRIYLYTELLKYPFVYFYFTTLANLVNLSALSPGQKIPKAKPIAVSTTLRLQENLYYSNISAFYISEVIV